MPGVSWRFLVGKVVWGLVVGVVVGYVLWGLSSLAVVLVFAEAGGWCLLLGWLSGFSSA